MDGRARVRGFLLGAQTDRAPVLAFASELSADLAHASVTELYADPHLLTEAFLQSLDVFGFDAIVLQPPVAAVREAMAGSAPGPLAALHEGIRRLRMLLADRMDELKEQFGFEQEDLNLNLGPLGNLM